MAAANTHSYRVVVIGGGGGSGGGGGDIGESVAVGVASDLVFPNEVYFCSSLLQPALTAVAFAAVGTLGVGNGKLSQRHMERV